MTKLYKYLLIPLLSLLIQGGACLEEGDIAIGDLDFGDIGNDLDDAVSGIEDMFGDVGNFFENLDFSSWAQDQLDAFNDALGDLGEFTSDQIDAINDALTEGGVESLESLEGFTEDQISSVKEALKEADSASARVSVGVLTLVAVVASCILQ